MARSIILVTALVSLIIGSFADPIFLLSSKKIDDASNNVFLDTKSFTNLLDQKFLQSQAVPNNIYIFNVKLNNAEYIQNPALILKELRSYPSLKNSFGVSPNTFSSMYVQDALSNDFKDQVISTIQKSDFETLNTDLKDFNFESVKSLKKTSGKNVLNVVDVSASELKLLDSLFHHLYANFGHTSRQNHLIILKFTDNSANAAPSTLLQTARVLQDVGDVVANPDKDNENTDTETPAKPVAPVTGDSIGISPAGFTGYIVAIFLFLSVVAGFQIMADVKSPSRFYKDTLQIGKEH
jgi:hypothetical protein